jgi:hypothetical protein
MDLIDYGLKRLDDNTFVDEELACFDIPSREGGKIRGPKDLTGRQDEKLTAIAKALPDDATNTDFFLRVLEFWIGLPGAQWNLGVHEIAGDDASRLVPLPLTVETLREIRRSDRAKLALDVAKLLYPLMEFFQALNANDLGDAEQKTDVALLADLEVEAGSQAAGEAQPATPDESEAERQVNDDLDDENRERPAA